MPYIIKKFEDGYKVCKKEDTNECFSNDPILLENAEKQKKAIEISEHMNGGQVKKSLKLLELFKGTGSVGKVARKLGYDVVSLDFEEKYNPDILTDILKWNYKELPTPDYIWASPPCNTFSPLAYPLKERNIDNAKPYSDRAKLGTKILYKTLEIIDYFLKKNPKLKFCIENPHGMMRKDPKMEKLPMETTKYCLYGDEKYKPTDFWSNYKLDLKQGNCKGIITVCDAPTIEQRYRMPPKLIKHILLQSQKEDNIDVKVGGGTSTHRQNVLKKFNLEDKSYSLEELSKISNIPLDILQQIYNRGIGAYKTNLKSVRLKDSYIKNVDAPPSQKLSKEQWATARVYSFIDTYKSNKLKHDTDLKDQLKGGKKNIEKINEDIFKKINKEENETDILDEKTYLKIAKLRAQIAGYNPKLLELSNDGIHKLEYNGVKFGREGYNDFIIYMYKAYKGEITQEEALKHRKNYLARATKIRGNWKSNKESPNNLAINILW